MIVYHPFVCVCIYVYLYSCVCIVLFCLESIYSRVTIFRSDGPNTFTMRSCGLRNACATNMNGLRFQNECDNTYTLRFWSLAWRGHDLSWGHNMLQLHYFVESGNACVPRAQLSKSYMIESRCWRVQHAQHNTKDTNQRLISKTNNLVGLFLYKLIFLSLYQTAPLSFFI